MNTSFDEFDDDKDFEMDDDGDNGWDDMEEQNEYIPIDTNNHTHPTKDLICARITGVYREEPLHINRQFIMNITIANINDKTMDDLSKIICRNAIDFTLLTKTQNLFVREWIKGISANGMKSNIYHDNKVKKIKLINALQMIDDCNVNINVSIASYGAKPEYCVNVDHQNLHKFNQENCPNLKSNNNNSDIKQNDNNSIHSCSTYSNMLANNKLAMNINNYKHMTKYYHGEKKRCKFGTNCNAFKRLENGGNQLIDKCHLILFDHPPRNKQIKLPDKFNPFVYDENYQHPAKLYVPAKNEYQLAMKQRQHGYLRFLLIEVIQNGFIKDLMCRQAVKYDSTELIKLIMNETDCGSYNKYIPLLDIVDEKLKHPRHIKMGCPLRRDEILALIMYTGCDSNYDLCKTQRDGNFSKWKWFDLLLSSGIRKLNNLELASHPIYSGINGVIFDKTNFRGAFITYTSTSWDKNVAIAFKGGDGNKQGSVLLEFDSKMRENGGLKCCDVSWISKFKNEKEILFGRNLGWYDRWKAVIVQQYGANQVVKLSLTA